MDIRIPSLLRIKPNALYKLGKYLRKNGFHRIALFYGEGIADLVGQKVEISLDSSEIQVRHRGDRARQRRRRDRRHSAFRLPREAQAIVAVGGGMAVDFGKYAGFLTKRPVIAVPTAHLQRRLRLPGREPAGRRPPGQLPLPPSRSAWSSTPT